MCVVDFSCSACFLLLYYVLVLIFWFSFSFILRSVVVFTTVYVDRVSFFSTVRVCSNPLLFCCLSLVPFVIFSILLHLASMDLYSYSVWIGFLQVLVFVCQLVAMPFLRRSCVFFSISLLFLFIFVFFNVLEVATVRESCVLPFSCFLCVESLFEQLGIVVAPVILAVLSLHVHVCCRFLLPRLLFIYLLCIIIDILAFVRFHSSFWRCFYESVCIQSVFLCNHVYISRLVASSLCFFASFCSL